jgi:succinate-semialdehyde dehydrogenase/glutarate-semialdehyde dehydrogenase
MLQVWNPATGKLVGEVEPSSSETIGAASSQARAAQKDWRRRSFRERAEILARFHDLVIDRSGSVLDTIQSETGKSRRDALAELVTLAGTVRYYLTHGERFLSSRRKRGPIPLLTRSVIDYRPHGLVGSITPWNYPFLLAMGDAIPALLAGNATLLKPSEWTPLSAELGKTLLVESGLDPALLSVVHGGSDVGSALISHVDYVAFTGGASTGRKVAVAASERLIPFSLELGGKNPMIVLKEAPLEKAAAALVAGAFANAGQTCIAVERVYVEAPIFDNFAQLVVDGANRLRIGWSQSYDVDMGSMIRPAHAAKVRERIEGAVHAGAFRLTPSRGSDLGPAFVEPTVLANVNPEDVIDREETFGPAISLHRVENREKAIALANDSRYGLNASVWAGGSGPAMEIARRLETGTVGINAALMVYNAFDLPMGGVKQSGIGRRHGEKGILRFTQEHSIAQSFEMGGGYDGMLAHIQSDRSVTAILKLVRLWRRIPGLR